MSILPSAEQVRSIANEYGTPTFVYDEQALENRAREALAFPHAFGLTVRYAMKANPNGVILQLFDKLGLHIDASSGFEAERALIAGIDASKIQLTAQELPGNLRKLVRNGVLFNACSLHQLEVIAKLSPTSAISIRVNPGQGSGAHAKVNVGGSMSSFGIWHKHLSKAKKIILEKKLRVERFHSHIGSGTDPHVWQQVARITLNLVKHFPDVHTVNLGGGFKVARIVGEQQTDLQSCGRAIKQEIDRFYRETGRRLHLEIEPGTFLTANTGWILARIIDVVETDTQSFIKIDSGMTENTRPALYGSQHPIVVIPIIPIDDTSRKKKKYLVVGHCCENGDRWTVKKGDGDTGEPRQLHEAGIGDLLLCGGTGAYCSSMSTKNYNSFPEAAEVMIKKDGVVQLMRRRQTLKQIVQ
ncbi:diaminopimelate decarboxylase [Candidatus Woesearchaeota archaeon]|nr:diaminopimelate decarboxylase [Candidatus Woesearchaeota archaeon]